MNAVTQHPALAAAEAQRYYAERLARETDCTDVASALHSDNPGFVLLDVRNASLYAAGHAQGALSLPHREINAARMADYPADTLFVVYCAGPHCNGAHKAALKLSELGFAVKEMLGGWLGWQAEALPVGQSATRAVANGCGC